MTMNQSRELHIITTIYPEMSYLLSQASFKRDLAEKRWQKVREYFSKIQKKSIPVKTKAIISLEFHDLSTEELKNAGLPEAKLLPIPGK